jgi:hypothetical protein
LPRTANFPSPPSEPRFFESSHIAIRKDTEALLRLMNSTGRLVVHS